MSSEFRVTVTILIPPVAKVLGSAKRSESALMVKFFAPVMAANLFPPSWLRIVAATVFFMSSPVPFMNSKIKPNLPRVKIKIDASRNKLHLDLSGSLVLRSAAMDLELRKRRHRAKYRHELELHPSYRGCRSCQLKHDKKRRADPDHQEYQRAISRNWWRRKHGWTDEEIRRGKRKVKR